MGAFKCYWEGGPLDPYRYACLASYGIHGHSIALYSNRPPANLPAGVEARKLTAAMQASPLEHQLISGHDDAPSPSGWTPIDMLCLPPQSTSTGEPGNILTWIEAFQLWLPEYNHGLRLRARHLQQLPLHLSFSAMAGIDLQCLPPRGSFLDDLLTRNSEAESALPRPHHDAEAVRLKIQLVLRQNQTWTQEPLERLCGSSALKDLGLASKVPFSQRLKRKIKSIILSNQA